MLVKSYAPSKVKGANCFLRMEWKVGKEIFAANYFPQLFKDVTFEAPKLSWKLNGSKLTVTSENYARFVYVDIPLKQVRDVTLSDNYFDLIPGETRTVEIVSKKQVKTVDVKSLLIR